MLRSLSSSCLWVPTQKVPRKRLTLSLKTMGCYSWGPQPWIPPWLSWHLKLSQRDFCKGVQAKAEQSLDQCHLLWAVPTWGRSWALAREGPVALASDPGWYWLCPHWFCGAPYLTPAQYLSLPCGFSCQSDQFPVHSPAAKVFMSPQHISVICPSTHRLWPTNKAVFCIKKFFFACICVLGIDFSYHSIILGRKEIILYFFLTRWIPNVSILK